MVRAAAVGGILVMLALPAIYSAAAPNEKTPVGLVWEFDASESDLFGVEILERYNSYVLVKFNVIAAEPTLWKPSHSHLLSQEMG